MLQYDPDAVYKDSQFEKYLGANLVANTANPDRQRCGNLESVIDMASGVAGARNAQKKGCTDQIRDAVIVGGLSGAEHAVGSVPIIGPLIAPITEGVSNGIIDVYYGSNKTEAEAAKSAISMGSEVIAPATTAYNIVALGKVTKELAKVSMRLSSKSVIDVASRAGYDALKNNNQGKASAMKSIVEKAGKVYDLAASDIRVLPMEAPKQAANIVERALQSAKSTIVLPRLRSNIGESAVGRTMKRLEEEFPKTMRLIQRKIYGDQVEDAKKGLELSN